MTTITELAVRTRKDASEVVQRHKKRASFQLYTVLASCLELCERCDQHPIERIELERLFESQPHEGNRRYVESGSDIYVLVCRFVFAGTHRTNAIRYSQALREAVKLQIRSGELEQRLRQNGGINALYFRRPLTIESVSTKTLRLARSITVPRGRPFTLTLQWTAENTFQVQEVKV